MSEHQQAPQIRLQVDQEIYVDAVRSGDVVEDATVATEVTSLERMGDAFVLEGALVFAGYLKHGDANAQEDAQDVLDFADESEGISHIHQRLPFVLRVPQKAQPRGLVNVNSRIASWELKVVSPGWLHVLADLHVHGLNGDQGYHFACGSQQEGDIRLLGASAPDAPGTEVQDAFQTDSAETAEEAVDGVPDVLDVFLQENTLEADLALARGSYGPDTEPSSEDPLHAVEAKSVSDNESRNIDGAAFDQDTNATRQNTDSTPSAAKQLAEFDKVFAGGKEEPANPSSTAKHPPSTAAVSQPERSLSDVGDGSQSTTPPEAVENSPEPAPANRSVEFEVAHQLNDVELHAAISERSVPEESFVASRSFSEEGFQATAGFVPTVRVQAQSEARQSEPEEREQFDAVAEGDERGEVVTLDKGMWSFVDFNTPDSYYTMRFVVVLDDETIETVAERVGCGKTELIHYNRLDETDIRSGQTLAIPPTVKAI